MFRQSMFNVFEVRYFGVRSKTTAKLIGQGLTDDASIYIFFNSDPIFEPLIFVSSLLSLVVQHVDP